jgi:hypothetical protein
MKTFKFVESRISNYLLVSIAALTTQILPIRSISRADIPMERRQALQIVTIGSYDQQYSCCRN